MTVITHHPIVIHSKGIAVALNAIDEYLTIFHLEIIPFVSNYRAFIYCKVIKCKFHTLTTFRNPHRTIVVNSPTFVSIQRIDSECRVLFCDDHTLTQTFVGLDAPAHLIGQRNLPNQHSPAHAAQGINQATRQTKCLAHLFGYVLRVYSLQGHKIVLAYLPLTALLFGKFACQYNIVVVLYILMLCQFLTIDKDNLVLYLKNLTRQSDAALHIILAAVNRTMYKFTEIMRVRFDIFQAIVVYLLIQRIGQCRRHCINSMHLRIEFHSIGITHRMHVDDCRIGCCNIARRIVEHDNVATFNLLNARNTLIIPLHRIDITLTTDDWHRMLCKRHTQRRLWLAGAIVQLAHKKVIAHHKSLFKRRSGYHIVLKKIDVDKIHGHQGKDNRIYPTHHASGCLIFKILPPFPWYEAGCVTVDNEWNHQYTHPAFHPQEKSNVKHKDDTHLDERLAVSLEFLATYLEYVFCHYSLFRS